MSKRQRIRIRKRIRHEETKSGGEKGAEREVDR